MSIQAEVGTFFTFGGEQFFVDMSKEHRPTDNTAFSVRKSEPYIHFYEEVAKDFKPRTLLELGIFQGGSFVLLDKIFNPSKMSAVELSPTPVVPLMDYVSRTAGRSAHFATSQIDEEALTHIVSDEFGGVLDMVIDDASHDYAFTKKSFEILFPLLAPGGCYIIEDWAWAHHPTYQGENAPWANRPALTTLLFEQIMLMGSTLQIFEIRLRKPFYIIRKNMQAKSGPINWEDARIRGKKFVEIDPAKQVISPLRPPAPIAPPVASPAAPQRPLWRRVAGRVKRAILRGF